MKTHTYFSKKSMDEMLLVTVTLNYTYQKTGGCYKLFFRAKKYKVIHKNIKQGLRHLKGL